MASSEIKTYYTEVIDSSKSRLTPSDSKDSSPSAPLVKTPKLIQVFPRARKPEIPFYTTSFGKTVLSVAADLGGYISEGFTGIKHRILANRLETNLHPDVSVIDTDGLQVTISLPVTQVAGLGSTTQRVRAATKGFLASGKYSRQPQLPPGEITDNKSKIIPTPSGPENTIDPNTVKKREKKLSKSAKFWPIAKIKFQAGGESQALNQLKNRKLAGRDQETTGMLMPDLDLSFILQYVSQTGNLLKSSLTWPLSQASLVFDENGEIIHSPNELKGKFFHPALLSLKDFAALASAQIFDLTGKSATIDPKIIHQAMLLAPKADKDTEWIIGPYINRMEAVGTVSHLLTAFPGEFALGLARIVNIVDQNGNPHPQATKIATGIIANIMGFSDAPHPHGSPLTYVGLVSSLNQTLHDGGSYLQWAGNARIVDLAVNKTRKMPELYELVKKMGITDAESLAQEYRQVMSAGEFFGLALTPQVLSLSAVAILRTEQSQARIIENELLKTIHILDTIDAVVAKATQMDQKYWQDALDEFLAKVREQERIAAANKIKAKTGRATKTAKIILSPKSPPSNPETIEAHFIKPSVE